MKCFKNIEWFRMLLLSCKEKENVKSDIHAFLKRRLSYPNQTPKAMPHLYLRWYKMIILNISVSLLYISVSFLLRFLQSWGLIKPFVKWKHIVCLCPFCDCWYNTFISFNKLVYYVCFMHYVDLIHQDYQILHLPLGKYFCETFTF